MEAFQPQLRSNRTSRANRGRPRTPHLPHPSTIMATKALESKDAYTVGWIAALDIEHAAAIAMLDEEHSKPLDFSKPPSDPNAYAWGRIGTHNIVIALLPAGMYGQSPATATATHMISSFPQIRIGLLVGIGGGIPRPDDEVDIRLGDVVVSQPSRTNGGVAQYDTGKATAGGAFELRGFLNSPPLALLNAVAHLKSQHERQDPRVHDILQEMLAKNGAMAKARPGRPSYSYQGKEHDRLFEAAYSHKGGKTCAACDPSQEIHRDDREQLDPVIHYGLIASGNAVIRDAAAQRRSAEEAWQRMLMCRDGGRGPHEQLPLPRGTRDL